MAAAGALSDPLDGCLVQCGGDLYFAADFTSGGLPSGLRVQRLENGDLRIPDLDGDADDLPVENDHYLAPADPYRGRFRPAECEGQR